MSAYEVLGIPEGSDQKDIKRAYFRLIREHSPEKDPEGFSRIREAYESLKDRRNGDDGPSFSIPDLPYAKHFLRQIEDSLKAGNNVLARDTAEEAMRAYPGVTCFKYMAAQAQLACGNSGKAWKNAQELAEEDPDNQWFWKLMALAGLERGFFRKAQPAFKKAYELGVRDLDFIISYSINCRSVDDKDTAWRVLLPYTEDSFKWKKDEMHEALEIYTALSFLAEDSAEVELVTDRFCSFLDRCRPNVAEEAHIICGVFLKLCAERGERIRGRAIRAMEALSKSTGDPRTRGEYILTIKVIGIFSFNCDKRMCRSLKYRNEIFRAGEFYRFTDIDCKLCMLEEREKVLEAEPVLMEEYPEFYEEIRPFINRMRTENDASALRYRLHQDYRKMLEYEEGGNYLEWFPARRDDVFGKPVVSGGVPRNGFKKIGRNDPCPCGSGRKYKHCCGKN
ncbi:MAG: SEC-C metal-binding domain-containing protein [Lachnospiraceae bacterium]|nr:SEC-C metal-binding domain-containing protein [Lachnospiraceae bacterium]